MYGHLAFAGIDRGTLNRFTVHGKAFAREMWGTVHCERRTVSEYCGSNSVGRVPRRWRDGRAFVEADNI